MENFIYNTPTKIYFGKQTEEQIGQILTSYNVKKVLLLYGQNSVIKSGLLDKTIKNLESNDIKYVSLGGIRANPTIDFVRKAITFAISNNIDFVLAVGGGSVIDTAKAVALGVANPKEDVWEYYLGNKTPQNTIKKGAILTLSAAGSEMSNSSVISNDETHEKRGLTSELNRLDFAIENPELTYSVNKYQTACGVVDISMHTIERYFDIGEDTDLTDSIALAIIKETFLVGKNCIDKPNDYPSRANMMWASSIAHNGLTHCGRKFMMPVHQLEHEISGLYPNVAHGAGLAALWCSWARYVYKDSLDRFILYAQNVWGIKVNKDNKEEAVLKAINYQEKYYQDIGMPTSLEELDVKETDLEKLALACSRNKTRIIPGYKPLGYQEILDIYRLAYPKKKN